MAQHGDHQHQATEGAATTLSHARYIPTGLPAASAMDNLTHTLFALTLARTPLWPRRPRHDDGARARLERAGHRHRHGGSAAATRICAGTAARRTGRWGSSRSASCSSPPSSGPSTAHRSTGRRPTRTASDLVRHARRRVDDWRPLSRADGLPDLVRHASPQPVRLALVRGRSGCRSSTCTCCSPGRRPAVRRMVRRRRGAGTRRSCSV